MEKTLEQLQYPIGRFSFPAQVSEEEIKEAIHRIAVLPLRMLEVVRQIPPDKLETPYRPGGWTIRQVVHHVADSHINAYIRYKLALTEQQPTIKPYLEKEWAKLDDSKLGPEISLVMLGGIHKRWVTIMEHMSETDWDRRFVHPEHNRTQTLRQTVMLYAWHGEHHLGHIELGKQAIVAEQPDTDED